MLDASQRWSLFGYDVSRIGHYLRAGWTEFLYSDTSPILPVVDEGVLAHLEGGDTLYIRGGQPAASPPDTATLSEAVVLPASLILAKSLWLPAAAESDIESVIAIEVNASSPFPAADTCFGWALLQREEERIEVQLVISAMSAAMTYIAEHFDTHDVHAYEAMARIDGRFIALRGFGEDARLGRNRRRLARMALTLGACLILLIAISAVSAGVKYLELQRVVEMQQRAEQAAEEAVALRESMADARSMLDVTEELMREYPSPYGELQRLTRLLENDTWISGVEFRGDAIRLEGQSANASTVMQQLLDDPAYASVQAPVAFRADRTGGERFVFDLTLETDGGAE